MSLIHKVFMRVQYFRGMKYERHRSALGVLASGVMALTACTDGASGSISGSSLGVTTINVSLSAYATTAIPAGLSAGYAPAQLLVPVGTQIRFVNQDSFAHTASAVDGITFPVSSPLTASALTPSASGRGLSAVHWTSGNLAAGAASPKFIADAPGTYLFGCFYHFGAPMRGAIVVH